MPLMGQYWFAIAISKDVPKVEELGRVVAWPKARTTRPFLREGTKGIYLGVVQSICQDTGAAARAESTRGFKPGNVGSSPDQASLASYFDEARRVLRSETDLKRNSNRCLGSKCTPESEESQQQLVLHRVASSLNFASL